MNRRQKIIVSVTGIFLVLLILVGLTYAYFLTRIDGNDATKSISVTTANLAVKYSENDPTIITKELIKPDTVIGTKEFIVTNTGNATNNYSIVIDEVENNFERTEDLEYVLKRGEDILATGEVKRMETQIILSNISIEVGEENKHTYNFTVKYKEANTDQSVDMNKHLSLRLNIRRVSEWETAPEGTLLAAIKRDNEVEDTLSIPGINLSGKKNTERIDTSHNMGCYTFKEDYYYTYSSDYKYDKKTGTYSLINPITILGSEITEEIIQNYYLYGVMMDEQITPSDIYTGLDSIYTYKGNYDEDCYYFNKYLNHNINIDESLLSSTEDDYGTSYYYRGSVDNNFVTFSNMCWRIVRVQGDGTIKLVLADELHTCNDTGYDINNGGSAFINNATNYPYSNIKYKTDNENVIPEVLSTWMNRENFVIDTTKLATTAWCIDTSISEVIYYGDDNATTIIDGSDSSLIKWTKHIYSTAERLENIFSAHPTLKCNMTGLNNSKATKVNANIGLLTLDELAYAGATSEDINNTYYIFYNTKVNAPVVGFHTISPKEIWYQGQEKSNTGVYDYHYGIFNFHAGYTQSFDSLSEDETTEVRATHVRPSIVLKSDVTIASGGNGKQSTPYVIN